MTKKLAYREFIIALPILKTQVLVLLSKDITRCAEVVRTRFQGEFEEWDSSSTEGKTLRKQGYGPIIWMKQFPKSPAQLAVLHHEVVHAVAAILQRINLPMNYDTEEVYAYLGEYLFHEILKQKK